MDSEAVMPQAEHTPKYRCPDCGQGFDKWAGYDSRCGRDMTTQMHTSHLASLCGHAYDSPCHTLEQALRKGRQLGCMVSAQQQACSVPICASFFCKKPGTMACPTCKRLNVSTLFCGQQCFASSWAEHKHTHKAMKADMYTVHSMPEVCYKCALAERQTANDAVPGMTPNPKQIQCHHYDKVDQEDEWDVCIGCNLADY